MVDEFQLRQRARELGPWHFDFQISPGVTTASFNDPEHPDPNLRYIRTIDSNEIEPLLKKYWPEGLSGKDVLDVGCNAGGHCFVAYELGARRVTGIDARSHWIDQANWIKSVKYANAGDAIFFEQSDIRKFLEAGKKSFDIVLFNGLFCHLADPVGTLMDLCDATREFLLVDTASSDSIPETCMAPVSESTTHVMSGVDGLAWLPGGPEALRPILEMKGFHSIQRLFWLHGVTAAGWGKFRIAASRRRQITGFVDFFRSPNSLAGWAREEHRDEPLAIKVSMNGLLIGATENVEERPAGKIGFNVTLSQTITLADIGSGAVKVHCVDTDGEAREIQIWPGMLNKTGE